MKLITTVETIQTALKNCVLNSCNKCPLNKRKDCFQALINYCEALKKEINKGNYK